MYARKSRLFGTVVVLLAFAAVVAGSGCSHAPAVKSEAYAKLSDERTFEYEFPVVWKATEAALRNYRIVNRDPSDVDANEMRKLRKRTLETDWIYAQSRDKYVEYSVNGSPRKTFLQTRVKYRIEEGAVLGGTHVLVKTQEEIERLNADGSPAGYESSSEPDSSRANEMIKRINLAILSAAP